MEIGAGHGLEAKSKDGFRPAPPILSNNFIKKSEEVAGLAAVIAAAP